MRGWMAAAAVALLAMAGTARAASPDTFLVEAPSGAPQGPQTVAKGKPLFSLPTRSPRAIVLDEDIAATATNAAGVKLKRPLTKGTVLVGMLDRPWVYCAPIRDGLLYSVAPCLSDKDQDGKFEILVTIGFTSAAIDTLAITEDGFIYGSVYGKPAPLAAPVAYHAVDYRQGQAAQARVRWASNYDAKTPGKDVNLGLWLDVGKASTGTGTTSEGERFRLPGGKGTVTFNGVKIEVLGFSPAGELRYQVLDPGTASQPTLFLHRPGTNYIFVYY